MRAFLGRILPAWMVLAKRYHDRHGILPNLWQPKTLNEYILRRIAFDRNPLLAQFADKWRVREYVKARLGPEVLPRIYHLTDDPDTIPFDLLPERFVVKPTHGSGWVRIIESKMALDQPALLAECRQWLSRNMHDTTREWIYKHIPPRIMVEELIDDGTGKHPIDYKFLVFAGKVKCILAVTRNAISPHYYFFTPDWKPLDVVLPNAGPVQAIPMPSTLPKMIAAAEILGAGIAFIRVDLYSTGEKIFFGELTTSPGCGLQTFDPPSFDAYLGAFWPGKVHKISAAQVERKPLIESLTPIFASINGGRPCTRAGLLLLQPAAVKLREIDWI